MSLVCPNKSLPEWKELVSKIGEKQAYYEFFKNNEIPDPSEFTKKSYSDRQKYQGEDIEHMQKWFNNRFKDVSFNVVKDIIDGGAFGQFHNGMVTLWERAEAGTGYHEAFHVVTQLYLSPSQRKALYDEARNVTGKDLSEFQAEEYLAEKFREYMLSGQQPLDGFSRSNNIFKKLWRMLSNFLTGSTTVHDVFNKLASPAGYSNRKKLNKSQFSTLNRILEFSEADSTKVLNVITGIVLQDLYITQKTEVDEATQEEFITYHEPAAFNKLSVEEKRERINNAYKTVYVLIRDRADFILNNAETDEEFDASMKLQEVIDRFDEVKNEHLKHLVKYGISINKEEKVDTKEEDDKEVDEESKNDDETPSSETTRDGREYMPANEKNPIETLSNNTKLIIAQTMRSKWVDEEGGEIDSISNDLGLNEVVNFKDTYNYLVDHLSGSTSYVDIWDRLTELSKVNPDIKALTQILGSPYTVSEEKGSSVFFNIWRDFAEDFSKTFNENTTVLIDASTGGIYSDLGSRHNIRDTLVNEWRTNLLLSDYVDDVDGILTVKKDVLSEKNPIRLLEMLGVDFSGFTDKEVITESKKYFNGGLDQFVDSSNGIREAIKVHKGPITDLFTTLTNAEGNLTFKNDFLKLADMLGERYKGKIELSMRNPEGKKVYAITRHNYLSLVVDSINKAKTKQDVIDEHPHLFNLYNKNSHWFKSLFLADGTRNPDVKLEMSIVGGVKAEGGDGTNTTSLTTSDRIIQEVTDFFRRGGVSLPRASDKSTEYAIRVVRSNRKPQYIVENKGNISSQIDNATKALYSSFEDELSRIRSRRLNGVGEDIKVYGTNKSIKGYLVEAKDITEDTILGLELYVEDVEGTDDRFPEPFEFASYLNYLMDNNLTNTLEEQENWLNVIKPLGYIPNSSKAANWSIFEEIFDDATKAKLEPYLNTEVELSPSDKVLVEIVIGNYLTQMLNEEISYMKQFGMGTPVSWKAWKDGKQVTQNGYFGLSDDIAPTGTAQSTIDALLGNFILNHFLETIEYHKVFIGDPALFKDKFKRISAFTGDKSFVKGGVFTQWINNNIQFKAEYQDSDTISALIVKDMQEESDLLKEYVKYISEARLSEYGDMTIADAQGLIDIIAYRRINKKANRFTDEQEKQYIYEMMWEEINWNGKKLGEFTAEQQKIYLAGEQGVFPIAKFQYAGPQDYSGDINAQAFHKYSLAPIFPRLVAGTPLEAKLKQMRKAKVAYMVFDSGSKVGTKIGKDGSQHNFKDKSIKPDHIQKIHTQYLGVQVDIAPKVKDKVVFGTQFRKLIESNLFNGGLPSDYPGTIDEWSRLDEPDKKALSKKYALHSEYLSAIEQLGKIEWDRLISDISLGTNEDGSIKLDTQLLANKIRKEAISRNLSDNVIESVEAIPGDIGTEKVLKYQLDSLVARGKIENLLMSMVNSRVIKQMMPGDGMIQMSTAGFTKTYDKELLSYRKGKDGKTLPAQIKVTLNAQYKDLLELFRYKNGKEVSDDEAFNALNLAIREDSKNRDVEGYIPKVDKRLLTLVGYRIPTQGMNSIENLEIVEFLPPSTMNAIILPKEIVAKSGGDFDIDKLNIFRPNFYVESGDKTRLEYINDTIKKHNSNSDAKVDEAKEDDIELALEAEEGENPKYDIIRSAIKGYKKYTKKGAYVKYNSYAEKEVRNKLNDEYKDQIDSINKSIKTSWTIQSKKLDSLLQNKAMDLNALDELHYYKKELSLQLSFVKSEIKELRDDMKGSDTESEELINRIFENQLKEDSLKDIFDAEMKILTEEKDQIEKNLMFVNTSISNIGKAYEVKKEYNKQIAERTAKKFEAQQKQLDKLNAVLAEKEYRILQESDMNKASKRQIQNRIIEIASEVISDESNYELLITPNTVDTLKGIVKNIRQMKGISVDAAGQTTQLRFSHIVDQFRYFLGGKDGVGLSAIHNTFHTLFQLANTKMNTTVNFNVNRSKPSIQKGDYILGMEITDISKSKNNLIKVTLEDQSVTYVNNEGYIYRDGDKTEDKLEGDYSNVDGSILLGGHKDIAGRWISDTISQFINAYVDVAKDPFYKDLNAGKEAQAVYFYLIHAGADIETVGYFMNQPLVDTYISKLEATKGIANSIYGKNHKRKALLTKLLEPYVKRYNALSTEGLKTEELIKSLSLPSSEQVTDNNKLLAYIKHGFRNGKPVPPSTVSDKEYLLRQIQYVLDFERYHKDGASLGDLTRSLNQDTSKHKNLASIDMFNDLVDRVEKDKVFPKGTRQDILNKSIVGSFNRLEDIQKMYSPLFITETKEFKDVKKEIILNTPAFKDTDVERLHTLINNDFVNYLTQVYGTYNKNALHSNIDTLFKGDFSVAKRLSKVRDIVEDNYLLQQLHAMLTSAKDDVNNISMFNRKYTVDESNSLTTSFKELLDHNETEVRSFANDLVAFGILQSGLNNSPITYLGLIPHKEYGAITEGAIKIYKSKSGEELDNIHDDFKVRFFLKNIDKNYVVPLAKKTKKDGKWVMDFENMRSDYALELIKSKDASPSYVLWINTGDAWKKHTDIPSMSGINLKRYGYRLQNFYLDEAPHIEFGGDAKNVTSINKDVSSLPEGVAVINNKLSVEKGNEFIDLLSSQIKNQAYIENKAKTANYMFSFGLRWAKRIPNAGEQSIQGKNLGQPRPNEVSIKAKDSRTYGYFETDQNNYSLPSITELDNIKEYIESNLNIDMNDYDAVLGNIYEEGSFIHQHRDTTESVTAEGYPVIVVNLGADGRLVYDENVNSTYASYNTTGELKLTNGSIYAFGVEGKNRFTFHHRIHNTLDSKNPLKPITLPNGKVLTNYRITLTFRRAKDLSEGMPKTPKRISTTANKVIINNNIKQEITAKLENTIKDSAKKHLPKEQVKSRVATQYIGNGAFDSSTQRYAKLYDEYGLANTGNYSNKDIIWVSSNGKRSGRINPIINGKLNDVYKHIDTAINVGATIIMDTSEHLAKTSNYNIGEVALAQYMSNNGYVRQGNTGIWKPEGVESTSSSVKTYTGLINKLESNQVFVFGSNPEGRHGAGTAKIAATKFGAKYGQGEGLQGQSYALPTKDLRVKENNSLRSISIDDIKKNISTLYNTAKENPNAEFLVAYTNDGKNLNGYTSQEMADMFSSFPIPNNVVFNNEFAKLLMEVSSELSPQSNTSNLGVQQSVEGVYNSSEIIKGVYSQEEFNTLYQDSKDTLTLDQFKKSLENLIKCQQ
jgi:alkylated DNA repair dioxygenase AlkB/putative lipoic acid-binding regulatory protein